MCVRVRGLGVGGRGACTPRVLTLTPTCGAAIYICLPVTIYSLWRGFLISLQLSKSLKLAKRSHEVYSKPFDVPIKGNVICYLAVGRCRVDPCPARTSNKTHLKSSASLIKLLRYRPRPCAAMFDVGSCVSSRGETILLAVTTEHGIVPTVLLIHITAP